MMLIPCPGLMKWSSAWGRPSLFPPLTSQRGIGRCPWPPPPSPGEAFSTPEGLFHYRVLPFAVHRAPATFQKLMGQVLRPHCQYTAAYIGDIVVHSADCQSHLTRVEVVLGALRNAGLTANPAKCKLGLEEMDYPQFYPALSTESS